MTATLETITQELKGQGLEDRDITKRIHVGGMLALVEATYEVVNRTTMPLVLHRLAYDRTTNTVEYEASPRGRAPVPKDGALDMTMVDQLLQSMLKAKVPLLFEGKTGVGKTFTVEQLMKTIVPEENYRGLRLNANMSNVLQPYTQGVVDNGVVRIHLKQEELDRIVCLFIDEKNRGDTNQILQLQDGVVRLSSGERGELGVPIPIYQNGQWELDKENKRPLFVVSAQNPPATKDAKYSATKRTDAAEGNRDLKVDVPNAASTIRSSVLLLDDGNGQHRRFMETYKSTLTDYLGLSEGSLATLDQDWISMFAFSTDPRKTYCPSINSGTEFFDAMLLMVSSDLLGELEYDKDVTASWNDKLKSYGVDFSYDGKVDDTSQSMNKIRDIVTSFQEEVITRDITKAKKLADGISLTRRIKTALATEEPVDTYLATPNFITVQDVASSFAIMLHDKQDKHDHSPVTLIDTVLGQYIGIVESFAQKMGYTQRDEQGASIGPKKFTPEDRNMSVYNLAIQHAIGNGVKVAGEGSYFVKGFIQDLGASVAELKRLEAGNDYRKPILATMISDLTTLAGFTNQYSNQLEARMQGNQKTLERKSKIKELFSEVKGKANTPPIYHQKLTRVLGV